MNKHDELTGTFVLVHPNLLYDPAEKKNQVGIISSSALEDDAVMVSFGRDGQALFSADALLVLRKPSAISVDALNDVTLMVTEDFKEIMEVSLLADSPLMRNRRLAVEMSMKNPNVLEYTMSSLENELGLKQGHSIGR